MYKFRIEGKKVPVKVNNNLSLFEACEKTVGVDGGVVVANGKLIAFFCSYHKWVKVGFGANQYEREKINNFYNRK